MFRALLLTLGLDPTLSKVSRDCTQHPVHPSPTRVKEDRGAAAEQDARAETSSHSRKMVRLQ